MVNIASGLGSIMLIEIIVNCSLSKVCQLDITFPTPFSLNIFYFQQITSYTVQYIQFIRKLGLERKRKLIEFFSYYRVHCDMEGGLYHINL